jgi:TP901 family phage tail tape measure protein
MANTRALSVKFGTEGFAQAVQEMQRVGKSFDTALARAQQAVQEANLNILRGAVMGSVKRQEEAEKARSKAARDANQIISNSYRELRVKSETDLNNLRNQAISAYNAIRNSGVKSAQEIDRANLALKDRLNEIDSQLRSSTGAKTWGQNFTKAVNDAKAAIRSADLTLNQAQVRGNPNLAQTAKDARVRATWRKESAVEGAFGTLGVTREAEVNRQKRQLIDAYQAIRAAGVGSARDIANAEKALNAELKELDRTLRGTEGLLRRVSSGIGGSLKSFAGNLVQGVGVSAGFSAINAVANVATAPLTLPVDAAKKWADFETQLKAIKVAADGADIAPLRKEIETLAPAVGKLPSELADVAIELTRAGYSAKDSASLLKGVANAANGTGEELLTVGKIIRTTISEFKVGAQDYGKVSDILVKGANATEAGIGSLGEALKYVGPNALQSNQSLTDTVTLLGLLSKAGLEGSMAGTNLSEALQKLKVASAGASTETVVTTRGMKTASEAIDELGVNFRNADGTMRPLLETLPELRKALKALPQTDQDVIMRVLFGEQGGRAMNALLIRTDGEINTLRKSIENSGGAADKAGQEMTSGFGGALKRLQATIETGFIALGEAEAPGLQAATETAEELLTRLLKVDGLFGELNSVSQEFSDYLKKNPELVDELDRQLTELVRTSLHQASQNAKQLLEYLQDNPHAIADSVESIKTFITGLGEALKLAQQLGSALSFKFDPLGDTFKSLSRLQEGRETAKRSGFSEQEFDKRFKALEDKIPWYDLAERMKRRNELIEQAIASFGGGATEQLAGGPTPLNPGAKILPLQNFQYVGGGGSFNAPRKYGPHTGEDLAGAPGTPVHAVMGGMVTSLKILDEAVKSYAITIKAADGTTQRYLHVSPVVTPTQRVIAGQPIGMISPKDSLSSGPHAHFDVQRRGTFIDPKGYLSDATQLSTKAAVGSSSKIALPDTGSKVLPAPKSEDANLSKSEVKQKLEKETKASQSIGNQYQYLARIAQGESSGGKNIGPNPETGAYGEYQFTPETRKLLMNQAPNLDPWSKTQGTRDQSALKWIELYGQEIGVDIVTMIRKGEFEAVDKLLGQPGPSGFAQFSSLPGGTEASRIWQDPAMLRKFAPIGKVEGDTYYKQAEDAKKRADELVDQANKRADDRRKQQQEIERTQLEEMQKRVMLNYDRQTSQMPEGEAKTARATQREAILRQQTAAKESLQIEQTINQLIEERKQKLIDLQDPDKKGKVTGRDITTEINLLRERKEALDENLKIENAIAQNNTEAELAKRSKDLSGKVTEVNESVNDLKLQYADTTPEVREAQAIAQVNAEFEGHKKAIVEAIKATLDLITAKQAQGLATESEIATLEALKQKYLEVQDVQNKQSQNAKRDNSLAERQRLLDSQKAVGDIDSQIADAKATRLEKLGASDDANSLREQAAIAQEMLRYKQQLLDLDVTYKNQPALLDELKQKAEALNQLNLENVKDNFKSLGEVIQDSAASALTGFFTDVFSGTKSVGEAFQAMAKSILASIGQIAAQMLTKQIFQGLGGLFGGGGGGGNFLGSLFGGGFTSSFTGFPAFHDGGHTGAGGEFLALLQGNEFVMNPTATNFFGADALHRMNTGLTLPVGRGGGHSGGSSQVINVNVQATDANSFNRSEMQIGQMAAEQLYRAQRRNG